MKACLLYSPAAVETGPLRFVDARDPEPGPGEILVRIKMCGVCRTDLHVVEGELPPKPEQVPVASGAEQSTGCSGPSPNTESVNMPMAALRS